MSEQSICLQTHSFIHSFITIHSYYLTYSFFFILQNIVTVDIQKDVALLDLNFLTCSFSEVV